MTRQESQRIPQPSQDGSDTYDHKDIFRQLYEESPVGIFVVEAIDKGEFRYSMMNTIQEKLFGLTTEEVVGKSPEVLRSLLDEEAVQFVIDLYQRCVDTREPIELEHMALLNGKETWWFFRLNPLIDASGKVYRLIGNALEITDRKKIEHDLQDQKDYFRTFLKSLDDWVWEIDLNGVHTYSNDAVERLLGYTSGELIGTSALDLWPEELRTPDFIQAFRTTLVSGEGWKDVRARFEHRDGHHVHVRSSANPIHDSTGSLIGYRGIDHDITEDLRNRIQLEGARNDWETIFQAIGHPTVILDQDHTIIQANRAVEIASGSPIDEIIGKTCFEVFHRSSETASGCPMEALILSGDGKPVEMEMEAFGGTYIVNCTPILSEDGSISKVIHMATDITERNRTQKALAESEELHRVTVENIRDPIFITDDEGRFTYICPKVISIIGYSTEEIHNMGTISALLGEDLFSIGELDELGEITDIERMITNKRGEEIYFMITVKRVSIGEGTILVSCHDVTVNHLSKEALQMGEQKYRSLVEGMDDVIVSFTPDGTISYCSPNVREFGGYDPEEEIGQHFSKYIADQGALGGLVEAFTHAMAIGEPLRVEFLYQPADREPFIVEVSGTVIIDGSSDQPAGVQCIVRDVSEHREMEGALRESEDRFRTLAEFSPVGIYMTDIDGSCTYTNPRWQEMAGLTFDEALGDGWTSGLHPDDREQVFSAWQGMVSLEGKWGKEYRFRTPDGVTTWVYGLATSRKNEKGEVIGFIGVNTDITEQKSVELELRESREQLDAIFSSSLNAIMVADDTGKYLTVNQAAADLFGHTVDQLLTMNVGDLMTIRSPDAAHRYQHYLENGFEIGDFDFIRPNGDARYAQYHAVRIRKDFNLSILSDITDSKNAGQEIRDLKDFYGLILDNVHDGIWVTDGNDRMIFMNPGMERIAGVKAEDALGLNVIEDFPPETVKHFLPFYEKARAVREPQPYEADVTTPSGRKTVQSGWLIPRFDGEDHLGMICTIQDITEKKMAERALRESLQTSEDIVTSIPTGIYIYQFEEPDRLILIGGNEEAGRLTGIQFEEWLGKDFNEIWPNAREQGITGSYLETARTGRTFETEDLLYEDDRLSGAYRVRVFTIPGNRIVSAFENITEKKQAEEEQKRLSSLIENSRDFIGISTLEGEVLYINKAGLDLVGLEDLPAAQEKRIFEYVSDDMRSILEQNIMPALFRDGFVAGEGTLIDFRTGGNIEIEYDLFIVRAPGTGEPRNIAIIMRDISERKRAQETIKASLEEKVVLLKEIHHRVKNNLQIISSLLDLQTYAIEDEDMRAIFRESQSRIKSMALIHETLYRSEDFGHINVRRYMKTLLEHAEDNFGLLLGDFTLRLETDEIELNLDTAIPCGLMINELVSNALKYAFPDDHTRDLKDGEGNEVLVEMRRNGEDGYLLRIRDNGVGLPGTLDLSTADTLGLQLVSMLVEQLHGDILINRTHGTEFIITFTSRNLN